MSRIVGIGCVRDDSVADRAHAVVVLAQQGIGRSGITALCALDEKVVIESCDTTRLASRQEVDVKDKSDNTPLNGLLLLQVVLRPTSRNSNKTLRAGCFTSKVPTLGS